MSSDLRIGVVGAGVFGGYHAAKVAGHARARLSGVHDAVEARAAEVAGRHSADALALDALIDASDALIIASPASAHAQAALDAIAAGRHVLVEKPIAHTLPLAERIVRAADAAGTVLQVGHQERFVARAIGLDRVDAVPERIEAWRETPSGPRGRDVGVALDLMTHDIDLVLWLLGSDPDTVAGRTTQRGDVAEAMLGFARTDVALRASRNADAPRRVMRLGYPGDRVVEVDFNAKSVSGGDAFGLDAAFGACSDAADSLGAATDAFVRAVLDGDPVPVSGGHGLRALRIALQVDERRPRTGPNGEEEE